MKDSFTIFRVVGGNSRRKILNEYEIIPYLVIKETPRYYTVSKNGRTELQNKRTTSNSEWFKDINSALSAIESKIQKAIDSIHASQISISSSSFIGLPYRNRLYIVKFRQENFNIFCRRIIDKTDKAWRIDTERTKDYIDFKTKRVSEKQVGRSYIYHHQSQSHQPNHPFEEWIGTELDIIKKLVESYAGERIRYLHKCRDNIRLFVRNFEREHTNDD